MSTDPENILTRAEVEHLHRLEAIVQRSLDADVAIEIALAEISDASLYRGTHQTFDAYLRDRWGISPSRGHQSIPQGPDPLADLWEQAHQRLGGGDVTGVDIRVTVHRRQQPVELRPEPWPSTVGPAELMSGELLRRLRWLLTQSSGTIADVAHQLETRGADLDDTTREQLQDDVLVLDEELATVKALLSDPIDWDVEYSRLLAGEIPPFDGDPDGHNHG